MRAEWGRKRGPLLWQGAVILAILIGILPARADSSRVALVVGVSAYQHAPVLRNPANDARAVHAALDRLGFATELVLDPDRNTLAAAVRRFGERANGADAAVFYYAGHAVEYAGRNWLLPATADIRDRHDLRWEALDIDAVLEGMDGATRFGLVLLDACRDNPFRLALASGSRGTAGGGLAEVQAAVGTLVAFATAPGAVAADGSGPNSPFTAALLRHIEQPGLEVRQMLAEVRHDVREATHGRQIPWEQSAMEGSFYMRANVPLRAESAYDAIKSAVLLVSASAASEADRYAAASEHKAFAMHVESRRTFRWDKESDAAKAEQYVLEGCELQYAGPCVLVAVDTNLKSPNPRTAERRTMERIHYAGQFRLDEVPLGRGTADVVKQYAAATGPKAMAIRPYGNRLWIQWGTPTQQDAERQALAKCNADGAAWPCFLYAAGDQVVIGKRQTEASQAGASQAGASQAGTAK